jgi:hypothetical protein
MRRATAPVKAPFSWPNSSDSSRLSGIAAQLTDTKGFRARLDLPWIKRAITSLPVPDSPVISTLAVEGAICLASLSTSAIAGSYVMKASVSSVTADRTAAMSSASGGSGTYSLAPARIAFTARAVSVPMPQATTGTATRRRP